MLQHLYNILINNIGTILIGLITFISIRHVIQVRRLPPGPFPLPILGNLLIFLLAKKTTTQIFKDLRAKYGEVFTVTFGSLPFVIVNDYALAKEALITKKTEFAGRAKLFITDLIIKKGDDIAFVDYSHGWEVLKKVGHTAIRKYVTDEKMPEVVRDTVDIVAKEMLHRRVSFNPVEHTYLLIFSLADYSAFGRSYTGENKEYLVLKGINDEVGAIIGNGFPVDFLPILQLYYRKTMNKLEKCMNKQLEIISNRFEQRRKTYQSGIIRDFSDALLASREEASKEDSEALRYMTDINLKLVISDLFGAGVDTTSSTLEWAIRYWVKYPEIQEKMYNEIQQVIGDRMAVKEDRINTPYIWAFISEVFRVRMAAPYGLPHKTMTDTEIGGHKIPKNTAVLFNYDAMNKNPEIWPEPETFRPERFLDLDGKFTKERLVNYVPFGLGRRSCVGEKLAKANLYLIIIRLLQKMTFEADGQIDMTPLDKIITFETKPCKVFVKPRQT